MSEIKETNSIADMAEYLASEIASCKVYDQRSIATKIKASLTILMDSTPDHKVVASLKAKLKQRTDDLTKKNEECIFWRKKLRETIGEEAMLPLYKECNTLFP